LDGNGNIVFSTFSRRRRDGAIVGGNQAKEENIMPRLLPSAVGLAALAATAICGAARAETLVGYVSPTAAQPGQRLVDLAINQAAK